MSEDGDNPYRSPTASAGEFAGPHRCPFQFTLRILFVLVTAFAGSVCVMNDDTWVAGVGAVILALGMIEA